MNTPAPTSTEIVEHCKTLGFLAKQLYVIFTTPTSDIGPVMKNLEQHLDYQQLLERRGVMFAAGPHWTDDEQHWEGDGMVVVRARFALATRSRAEAAPKSASALRTLTRASSSRACEVCTLASASR